MAKRKPKGPMGNALRVWQSIQLLHGRGSKLFNRLPDPEAADELGEILQLMGGHAAECREALAEAFDIPSAANV